MTTSVSAILTELLWALFAAFAASLYLTRYRIRQAKTLLNYRPEWNLENGIADYVKIMEKTRI